jgi:hypothetical protein
VHPVRKIVFAQGRRLTWVADQLGITYGYLWKLLLPPSDRSWRPEPEGFYERLADILDVEEYKLRPADDEEKAA